MLFNLRAAKALLDGFASAGTERRNLTGVLFEYDPPGIRGDSFRMVATDGHVLAVHTPPDAPKALDAIPTGWTAPLARASFIVSADAIRAACKLLPSKPHPAASFSKAWAVLGQDCIQVLDAGLRWQRVDGVTIDATFPDYTHVWPTAPEPRVGAFNARLFARIIDSACALADAYALRKVDIVAMTYHGSPVPMIPAGQTEPPAIADGATIYTTETNTYGRLACLIMPVRLDTMPPHAMAPTPQAPELASR